tara:strand:+ start:24784 stop:26337 length:1554 start_codon:yes stop_codon:yes gene_type:complete
MNPKELTTANKALTINLDESVYGTFAEIGAGQEVARHFFQVGAAAGTVAKSMSAYDMKFSDEIYGASTRYVSQDRLIRMLGHEYDLLEERLGKARGDDTRFFVFANTVSARNFKGTNECHGWMGVRFQLSPKAPTNDIVIHVRMFDDSNREQQNALGIIGVNLVYGAYHYHQDSREFIKSLKDGLRGHKIEIDMITVDGICFEGVDNRVLSMELVEVDLTKAVMFGSNRSVLQPSEVLYKKAIMLERGSFCPINNVHLDMLECAGSQFVQEPKVRGKKVLVLLEMTMHNLLANDVPLSDLLDRVDTITALGYHVLISNYSEYYRLSAYLRRYTKEMIGIVLGINLLLEIFNEQYYENLDGGILEACGRLFKEDIRLYAYPMKGDCYNQYIELSQGNLEGQMDVSGFTSDMLITAQNLQVKTHLRSLYSYLLENHSIEPVIGFNPEYLGILSRSITNQIKEGDKDWELVVPKQVANFIKTNKLWGYSNNGTTPQKVSTAKKATKSKKKKPKPSKKQKA